MGDGAIRCLAVYRLPDKILVAIYTPPHVAEAPVCAVIKKILGANATGVHPRLTVTDREQGAIHYEADSAAMFVAVTSPDYPQRTAFRAIGELRARFTSGLSDALAGAVEGGLSKSARPLLSELCSRYAEASSVDTTLRVLGQVDEVRGIMGESIQSLLHTHENLEVLEDRSEALRDNAKTFRKTARAVKTVQVRKHRRLQSISCLFLLVAVAVAAAPLIIIYWDDILAFLRTMLPPDLASNGTEAGSGDEGGSADSSGLERRT